MKISIASYAFHGLLAEGRMDVFGYLESVKYRYRLDTADLWSGTVGTTDAAYIRKVRQALDEKEMTVANYHIDGAQPWHPDPATREKNHQVLLVHLGVAEALKAQTVRIDFGGKDAAMSEEQCDVLVRRFKEYAKRAGDNGYRVGPETHFGPALVPENMARVYKAVNHPAYGILLHIGHWVDGREDEGDKLAAPWVMHTHVDAHVAATCLEAKMRLLLDAGYKGYWGVEHHSAKNEYSEVAWQLAEVQRVLARLRNP
ncbi:MAG: TIM barrel protein [Planctomycetota bacterium]|nr:TIM barrel protein [Planctomycetota bacterium]